MTSVTKLSADAAVSPSGRRTSAVLGSLAVLVSAAAVACDDTPGETGESGSPSAAVTASASRSDAPSSEPADAFIALAGGDGSARVPWAELVTYYIGGTEIGQVEPGPALPAALQACPEGLREYEGRVCPVSPLATVSDLLEGGSSAEVEPGAPDVVGCSKVAAPSPGAELIAVSIRPPTDARDCFSDFAVTLYSNAAGDVERIDFALSGP